jgi:hypothetical protein
MAIINYSAFGQTRVVTNTTTPLGRMDTYSRIIERTVKAYRTDISSKTTFGAASGSFVNTHLGASVYGTDIGPRFMDDRMNQTQDAASGNRTYSYASQVSLTNRFWYDAQGPSGSDYLTRLFENVQVTFRTAIDVPPWRTIRNISILSNGFCVSACSMFTTRLKQLPAEYKVTSYTFGGIFGSVEDGAVEVSQTCGGSVKQMQCPGSAIRQAPAVQSPYKFPGRPDFAVINASLDNYFPVGMTYNEYHWHARRSDTTPRQYLNQPGDIKIKLWNPTLEQRFAGVFANHQLASAASHSVSLGVAFVVVLISLCL